MVLVSKSTACKTLKNGKTKLNKGFREVQTKNGRVMYFTVDEKPKPEKKPRKKKEAVAAVEVEQQPEVVEFEQ